jgi:hypothetical protein
MAFLGGLMSIGKMLAGGLRMAAPFVRGAIPIAKQIGRHVAPLLIEKAAEKIT